MASRAIVSASVYRLCRASGAGFLRLAPRTASAALQPHFCSVAVIHPSSIFQQQQQIRMYGSKKKDKKSDNKKSGNKKGGKQQAEQVIGQRDPDPDPVDMEKMERQMQSRIEWLASELQSMRAGRASPTLLSSVRVQLKGGVESLSDLALVTVKDAHNLLVIPNSLDQQTAIETSIRNAGMGLNPRQDKNAVVVPVPKATKESREKLVKSLGGLAEQVRVQIRKVRHDAMKQLKNESKSSMYRDEVRAWEKSVQTVTDKFTAKIDELIKAKARDIEQA